MNVTPSLYLIIIVKAVKELPPLYGEVQLITTLPLMNVVTNDAGTSGTRATLTIISAE